MNTTIIRYFLPEDKDIEDKPNAFMLYKPINEVRLSDIRENFPLPGEYHYRFKFELKAKKAVWLDFNKEDAKMPVYDGKIIIKVNRISWKSSVINHNEDDFPDLI